MGELPKGSSLFISRAVRQKIYKKLKYEEEICIII